MTGTGTRSTSCWSRRTTTAWSVRNATNADHPHLPCCCGPVL